MLALRNYQNDILNKMRLSFHTHNRVLLELPCGAGKTIIAAYMAYKHNLKSDLNCVWVLVHRRELLEQTLGTIQLLDVPMGNIQVGMVQTVTRHLNAYNKPSMIIIDEAHHSTSKTYTRIFDAYPDTPIVGLTATPARLDGKPLGDIYDDLVCGVEPEWLIENGYLAPYKYFAPKTSAPDNYKVKRGDYDMSDVYAEFEKSTIYGDILEYIDPTKQGILYAPSIEFSKKIAEQINAKFGDTIAVHFDGETLKKDREQIVSDYRAGKIKILCNVDLIGEGFDVPDAEICYLCRPTLSATLYIQQSMRCMRYKLGKTAIIFDFVGNVYRHGMPTEHRDWSLKRTIKTRNKTNDKELLVRQCKNCFRVYQGTKPICPYCGYDNKKTRTQIKEEHDRELAEIKKINRRQQGMAYTYEQLVNIGRERHYKSPEFWAKMIMKSRYKKL